MAGEWLIVDYVKELDENSNRIITQEEIKKAKEQSSIPSVWLEKVEEAAAGKDIKAETLLSKLGVLLAKMQAEEKTKQSTDNEGEAVKVHRFQSDDKEANYQTAIQQLKFYIERSVEKWFIMDIDVDGYSSNIEEHRFGRHDTDYSMNDGDLNEQEYATKYGLNKYDYPIEDFQEWFKDWIGYELVAGSADFGVEFKEEDIAMLSEWTKLQLNRKLVKPGQYETASLYNRLGNDAYTRLITDDQAVSCCGGDITPPPASNDKTSCLVGDEFKPLFHAFKLTAEEQEAEQKDLIELDLEAEQKSMPIEEYNKRRTKLYNLYHTNTSDEVKNRLAWAAFKTPPEKYLNRSEDAITVWQDMPDGIYKTYHHQWNQLRGMTAENFRNLLKDEYRGEREKFEAVSSMSVKQIVDYIDIVESVTGRNWDDEDWLINDQQFHEIVSRVNGVYGDETVLEGKTRADVLPERQKLYEYLKKHDLLLSQFE